MCACACGLIGTDVSENQTGFYLLGKNIKVKESRNRPGVAQSIAEGLGSQISMTFGT